MNYNETSARLRDDTKHICIHTYTNWFPSYNVRSPTTRAQCDFEQTCIALHHRILLQEVRVLGFDLNRPVDLIVNSYHHGTHCEEMAEVRVRARDGGVSDRWEAVHRSF